MGTDVNWTCHFENKVSSKQRVFFQFRKLVEFLLQTKIV